MPAAAVIAGATAVASLISGLAGGNSAKRAAKAQAKIEKQVTTERIRQIYVEERQLAGVTRNRAAASGVIVNQGSVLNVLAEQATNFERERKTTALVGASRAAAALASGKATSQQFIGQGLSGLFAGLGQAASYQYDTGNTLFKPKGPG